MDSDPYSIGTLYPDLDWDFRLDPDPHETDADLKKTLVGKYVIPQRGKMLSDFMLY